MRSEDDWQAGRGADVVFFGAAFGQEKEALLQSAEAFVLPSLSEGLPMSVLEAWSYGLPVVMTPECNLPEGFTRGAGIRIESPESLIRRKPKTREQVGQGIAEGFRTLFDMSAAERTAMGLLGRRLVEERFTWPKVAAQMRQIYESLL
jgi:poly(glycerol-phosphate) alpha-glucosyltransferase